MSLAAGAAALRLLARNLARTSKMLRSKLAAATRAELQPIPVRVAPRQPLHPAARICQQKQQYGGAKWYSTGPYANNLNVAIRRYLSTAGRAGHSSGPRFDRSKLPVSNTSRAVSLLTGRAPFASTLRPNLTGGALPRTAGGYAMPGASRGGARYFSHTPAAPAQVVQNVSQAMRAFWLSGHRARYDGVGPNGEKRYCAISASQEEARSRVAHYVQRSVPGSFIDFHLSPTVTALSPLGIVFPFATAETFGLSTKPQASAATLGAEGFLDVLSVDFARSLKDLAAIMTDLQRLSGLGDLPVTLEKNSVLRVRFPGVDAETVERLCDDVGVQRGVIRQDADFDASVGVSLALRFPFAPDGDEQKTITSPGGSLRSHNSEASDMGDAFYDEYDNNPWLSSPSQSEGYASMSPPVLSSSGEHCSEDFEGLEGIYRFLEECDRARTRF
ncbi:hypothetical protein B0T26DRAFT_671114 [Lasiosphaeria miniovina]|uniref:Casein kinase II beta 2 subunit n=1 Tax=Lasiosphaeria miniovina TaxID=1954250 RepID=A0AA40EDZ7_9PEZI|nr:uncharacterized protein B0T26DRAFT_671114 [Lasiosphaeria miniovina]KAK0734887.1 hypothetical protein B0T26DRAFT_671114 [Lasiosphaeria miniovina]